MLRLIDRKTKIFTILNRVENKHGNGKHFRLGFSNEKKKLFLEFKFFMLGFI